jgi:hypothetical protein
MALFTYELRSTFNFSNKSKILLSEIRVSDDGEKTTVCDIKGFEVIKIEDFNIDKIQMSAKEAFDAIDAPCSCYLPIDINSIKKISQENDVILKYYWQDNPTCAGGEFLLVRKIDGQNEVVGKFHFMRA